MHQSCRPERNRLERKAIFKRGKRQGEKLVVKYLASNRVNYCRNVFRALLKIYDGVFFSKIAFNFQKSSIIDFWQASKYVSVLNNFRLNSICEVTDTAQKMKFSTKDFSVHVTMEVISPWCDQIGCRFRHIWWRSP